MGAEDVKRQAPNVGRMKLLGAKVIPVVSGSRTLKDAMNEALRDWVTNVGTTHYCIGSAAGPHPYPELVARFQSVIGEESRTQMLARTGKLPDAAIACVGGGSNAIGMFRGFLADASVKLYGIEAAGHGVPSGKHAATLAKGAPGVLHGSATSTDRSRKRTRSARGSTTPASDRSTPFSRTRDAPAISLRPTRRRSLQPRSSRGPKGSCPRSSPRTHWQRSV